MAFIHKVVEGLGWLCIGSFALVCIWARLLNKKMPPSAQPPEGMFDPEKDDDDGPPF